MRARWLGLLVVVGLGVSDASAAPGPKICAPSNSPVRWSATGRSVTACFPNDDRQTESCYAIVPGAAPRPVLVPPVVPVTPRAGYREPGGVPSACVAKRCTKLGPNAAAAVATLKKQYPATPDILATNLGVTGDGRVLVVDYGGQREAWRVDRDKTLDLVPPKIRHKDSTWALMSIDVAAGVMVATWEDCAGPCGRSTIVDSNGVNRGSWFGTGHAVTLDAQRLAILPTDEGASFLVLEAATGARLAKLDFGGFDMQRPAIVDDHTLVALWTGKAADGGGLWEFHVVSAPAGQPASLGRAIRLEWCRP